MMQDGTSHVAVIIFKFREVGQREHGPGRHLLDNSERVLAQSSKVVGFRGEQEELLVLGDPGGDSRSEGLGNRLGIVV
jgi:hypothetical protein